MAEPISRDDAAHVAKLARLDLTDDELERFTGQLGVVLEHAADIAALDIADVPPTAHPLPLVNVLRDDEQGHDEVQRQGRMQGTARRDRMRRDEVELLRRVHYERLRPLSRRSHPGAQRSPSAR